MPLAGQGRPYVQFRPDVNPSKFVPGRRWSTVVTEASQLDRPALMNACHRVVRTTMWARHPIDADRLQAVARSLCEVALTYEDQIVEAGRDPNLLRFCVEYLETTQAIPPMADDTRWFADMLSVLVELAVPNTVANTRAEGLYREIEAGIAVSRSSYAWDGRRED